MGRAVEITPGACILWALLLLLLPLKLLLAAAAAAGVHELCHILAIRLTGGRLLGLTVGAGGMTLETLPMSAGRELACALAGPLGSFSLLLLGRWLPLTALWAFFQGCFNLLPLYPLDGGRAAGCILALTGRESWMPFLEMGTLLLLLAAAAALGWEAVAVWSMVAVRKIPCKATRFALQ